MTYKLVTSGSTVTGTRKLAIIGDQLTSAGLTNGFKTASSLYSAVNGGNATNSWWCSALAGMAWPYELVAISAASGRTTATAAAAFTAEVVPSNPQEVWIMLGRNDMGSAAAATTALASLDTIIAACQQISSSMIIVIGTVIPGDSTSHTASYQQANAAYNYGILRRAQGNPNIRMVDVGGAVRDQTTAASAAISGYISGSDHLNLTVLGHGKAGAYWAGDLLGAAPNLVIRAMGNDDDFSVNSSSMRMITNPCFVGTGGTASGGTLGVVPNSWFMNSNSAGVVATGGSITTDAGTFPKRWWPVALSGTASGTNGIVVIPTTPPTSPSLVVPGTTLVRGRYDFKASSLTNVDSVQVWLQIQNAAFNANSNLCITGISAPYPATFTLEIPPTVVAAGGVNLECYVTINFTTGNAVSGTLSISQPIFEVVV